MGERIVLGLGDNVDYEIEWDSSVFERLIDEFGVADSELSTDKPISSTRDLLVSILGFLKSENRGGALCSLTGDHRELCGPLPEQDHDRRNVSARGHRHAKAGIHVRSAPGHRQRPCAETDSAGQPLGLQQSPGRAPIRT